MVLLLVHSPLLFLLTVSLVYLLQKWLATQREGDGDGLDLD